ncbi:MAG: ATP-binding protein, partial [Muribaculaceae bacterium]|nr:ATP-binding protein [Muribaculaceae bacterium]
KVSLTLALSDDDHGVLLSDPLFEWVMENLVKNAVDAMGGEGAITISTGMDKGKVWIEVADTGKGIARKNFKNVFSPGFTTKKRGWGLGLTLVKRIIEDYHGGRIYVKDSEIGKGTTFRIDLPSA